MAITIGANTSPSIPTDLTVTPSRTVTFPLSPNGITSATFTSSQVVSRTEYIADNGINSFRGNTGGAAGQILPGYVGGSLRTRISGAYADNQASPYGLRGQALAPGYGLVGVIDLYSGTAGPGGLQGYIGLGGVNANVITGSAGNSAAPNADMMYSLVLDAAPPTAPTTGVAMTMSQAMNASTGASAFFPSPRAGVFSQSGYYCGGPGAANGFRAYSSTAVTSATNALMQSWSSAPSGVSYVMNFGISPGGSTGSISVTPTTTAFNTSSDYRLKENPTPIESVEALDVISKLRPRVWKWKSSGQPGVGFVAHELQEDYPDAPVVGMVSGEKDATSDIGNIVDAEGNISQENVAQPDEQRLSDLANTNLTWVKTGEIPNYQSVDSSFLIPHIIASIQALTEKLDSHEARISSIETKL